MDSVLEIGLLSLLMKEVWNKQKVPISSTFFHFLLKEMEEVNFFQFLPCIGKKETSSRRNPTLHRAEQWILPTNQYFTKAKTMQHLAN